jgi:hypothetical protein
MDYASLKLVASMYGIGRESSHDVSSHGIVRSSGCFGFDTDPHCAEQAANASAAGTAGKGSAI